jgi:ankyrin repeat protein
MALSSQSTGRRTMKKALLFFYLAQTSCMNLTIVNLNDKDAKNEIRKKLDFSSLSKMRRTCTAEYQSFNFDDHADEKNFLLKNPSYLHIFNEYDYFYALDHYNKTNNHDMFNYIANFSLEDNSRFKNALYYNLLTKENWQIPIRYLKNAIERSPLLYFRAILHKGISVDNHPSSLAQFFQNTIDYNDIAKTELLLKYGADVNATLKRADEATPLYYACRKSSVAIVSLLLKHPLINPNKLCGDPFFVYSPLHIACLYNRIEIVKLLVEHKDTDINIIRNKKTPLDIAYVEFTGHNYDDLITFLITNGAKTAAQLAESTQST